ncbi:AAA family ATPase [Marinobacterium sp. YM272]|uniref:AAA family ATPase n=1 Tax=Marinobacterium sp. YM272 TaxID=3421654 RepID=UPI003D7FA834
MDTDTRYFEPASRVQLASKLRHLLRFSDLMMLIVGEDGSGRSTVLNQLEVSSQEGEIRQGVLQCDATVDVTRLLQLLVDALDIDCPADADNRQRLKELHLLSRTLHESGIPLVLLIDDADYLTNNALELLTNFALLEDAAPRVVLTGTPEFEQRFLANELDQLLDGRLHVQLLGSFEEDEAEEFIESLLPKGAVLLPRRMKVLIEQSDAYPGRLYALVQSELRDGKVQRASRRAFPFPFTHLLAIGAVLLVIFGGALWLFMPDSDTETDQVEEVARVELPLNITAANQDEEPEVIEVRSELQQRLAEQEARLGEPEVAAAPAESSPATAEVAVEPQPEEAGVNAPEPSEAELTTEPAVAQEVEPQASTDAIAEQSDAAGEIATTEAESVKTQVAEADKPEVNEVQQEPVKASVKESHSLLRADELLEWPDEGYTLQLLGARSVDSVERFINAQAQPERFYYFRTMYKGAPWHVVVYGQFASRGSAMAAVETLPQALRKLRPWARSIAGVKSDIQK